MSAVETPTFGSVAGSARYVTAAGLAGLVAGLLIGGLGGRVFMRIAGVAAGDAAQGATTEAGFTVGEVTADGTVGLFVFVGVASGLLGAAWFVIFRPWLAWAGRWRGLVFGALLFAVASATSDVLNPDNIDFTILGNPSLLVLLILVLFAGFGLVIDRVFGGLERRLPPAGEGHATATVVYGLLAVLGLVMGGALLFQALFTTNMCTCEPPLVPAIGTVVAAVGTLLWMLSGIRPSITWVAAVGRALGLAGLVLASTGLIRALSDAAEVLAA
jgi:hypothetical protein